MARDLEVWAVSDDGEYVLLAGSEDASRATHQLKIDARLEAAVRGDLEEDEERRESELSPKEIQARLRAGDTVEEVAKAARVALPRIQRYAGPVISERERIVDQARATVVQRPRGPQGEIPLGRVVETRLAETAGLRPETVAWSARRRNDGAWLVELSYAARGGSRTAQWLWQPSGHELTSINALGTRLGVEDLTTARRKRPPQPAPAPAPGPDRSVPVRTAPVRPAPAPAAVSRPAPAKATAKKAAKKAVAKPAAKKSSPKKAAARKAVTRKAAAKPAGATATVKKAAPKKVAANNTARTKTAAKPTAAKRMAAKKTAAPKAVPQPRRRPARREPPVITPVVKRTNGRVEVPSWDDVLLGVRSPAAARGRRGS